ncbi:DUF4747 family protein [Vibrio vulnificus]|uniref:DUF4747 family protein n=1 Tax=Vibrio vulnificus TaxID=672 RepID=UPI001A20370F|nr:DUF4747 family protein [Vibrio vulnificus]EGR0100982.1 DUF4747 family protein [Vibrio vulnificus]EHU4801229.1 DUF4747 family protein [Vibrio vulnificus]EIT6975931.1 DUF4747 family protein [Vibrio vulnificus]EJO9868205.1 DUF4747 family protein [Vibrio vulnificus]EKG2505342.1 DUF4747 family protein [Vibrio vulnificus]
MAYFKFYNIQLLPMDTKKTKEVGVDGYCQLFSAIGEQIAEIRKKGLKLSSIAARMRGEMYFAPFSVSIKEYPSEDKNSPNKLVHGYFLKFDDVNELVDTESGELEYRSKGNTSSKRFQLEFVFDPINHIMAIHDTRGLPTKNPLIAGLTEMLDGYAHRLFPEHNLEIEELTAADSVQEFFEEPKQGITSYSGKVTFSNSDDWDEDLNEELRPEARRAEQELKELSVGKWETKYNAFKDSLMSDLPRTAKIQMMLATLYGNAEARYVSEDGTKKKYHMEDHPVREQLPEQNQPEGILNRAIAIVRLVTKAKEKTRVSEDILTQNKSLLVVEEQERQ